MPRGASIDITIASLAAPRGAVVHARELRSAGVSRDAVRHRTNISGQMLEVLPATYVVGPQCASPDVMTLCAAGVVYAGDGAFIDDVTAAALLNCWDRHDGSVHVGVDGDPPRTNEFPFVFHGHRRGRAEDRLTVGRVPVAAPLDLCAQLARSLTKWQVAFVIRRLMFHGLLDLSRLKQHAHALERVPWVRTLRGAIELVEQDSFGSRGPAEDEYLRLLVAASIPEPLVNVRGAAGVVRDEPDFLWRDRRLNIEIDGRYHDDPLQVRQDEQRDAAVASNGIGVFRLAAKDVFTRPRAVIAATIRLLRGDVVPTEPGSRRVILS